MSLEDRSVIGLESVSATLARFFLGGKLRQLCETLQHVYHIWIVEHVEFQQFSQVLHSRRNTVDEIFLTFEISAETVCAEHLQRAEQHEE